MATLEDENPTPALRFKRRKTIHPKRARLDDDIPPASASLSPTSATLVVAKSLADDNENDESVSNLKEILRNRKRPRDRLKEAARRAEDTRSLVLAQEDAPKYDQYSNRFVAQTGQVVDRDDKQMTEYVEARMAEKNYRQYGWPIPAHLEVSVAAIAPDLKPTAFSRPQSETTTPVVAPLGPGGKETGETTVRSHRLAAGMGKLQEVDLGPDATAHNIQRTEQAWKRLEGGGHAEEESAEKVRLGRDGKPRRKPRRRNSEDIRRDQMVEAVLREAKLDYFEEEGPNSGPAGGASTEDNDEAMAERFRLEFLESIESRHQQRKPPQTAAGGKGAKEQPKGPKLGGSRSARAAMRLQEEQAAKKKR